MFHRNTYKLAVLLPFALISGACDSSTGNDGDGQATVFLARSSNTLAITEPSTDATIQSSSGAIEIAAVDSVNVRVTGVRVLRTGGDTTAAGGWVTLQLEGEGGKRLNLMSLPQEGADSIKIARGELEPGTYDHIRLIVDDSDATITLNQDVVQGGSVGLTRGTHPLRLPSAAQSGLKIKTATFTVGEDANASVTLVFDNATSLGNIVVTGSGTAQMSPVLRSRTR